LKTLDRHAELDESIAGRLADPAAMPRQLSAQPWWHQSLACGALGIALLHVERAAAGAGPWRRAHEWLTAATRQLVSAGRGSHLFYGAPALAHVLARAAVAGNSADERTLDVLEQAITREALTRTGRARIRMDNGILPDLAEFDLIRGLTGFGSYLLRRDPGSKALRAILSYLVRLTVPVTVDELTVPGWWTTADPAGNLTVGFTGGHANLGMAHGIAGPLSLLAVAARDGITVDGQLTAITTICTWLDSWHVGTPAGAAWPFWISLPQYRDGQSAVCYPQRLGWCYGTAGIARALQLAGIAIGDMTLKSMAEHAMICALTEPANQAATTSPALCHGHAGLAVLAAAAAADASHANAARLRALSSRSAETTIQLCHHLGDAATGPGFLDGVAGIALAVMSARTGSWGWETCLLIT
jgi:lantibiotic biosynthesis protein